MAFAVMDSPIGKLLLEQDDNGLCAVRLHAQEEERADWTPLLQEARDQLNAYFAGGLREFDLPLSMRGSEFDRQVWQALAKVPFGEIRTYGQIARVIGREKAPRAVGGACGRNPLLILVPCHRIVGASGALTGFAAGMEAKVRLLEIEGRQIQNGRLKF